MNAKELKSLPTGSRVIDWGGQIFGKALDGNWFNDTQWVRTGEVVWSTSTELGGLVDLALDDSTAEFLRNTFYNA